MSIDPKKLIVICVPEKWGSTVDSILTYCQNDCGEKVWCSVTNSDKQAICPPCALSLLKEKGGSVGVTIETLQEVKKYLKNHPKK